MKVLKFQIRMPDGQIDKLTIEGERALIGTGAHCEIRLPVDQGKVEHVRVDLAPGGLFVTALSFEPHPTLNGIPFTQAPMPQRAVIGISQVQIAVAAQDVEENGLSGKKKKNERSPVVLIGGVLAIAFLGFFLFAQNGFGNASREAKAPALFDQKSRSCGGTGQAARELGTRELDMAESKSERSPFAQNEGVDAVFRFEQAAVCFDAVPEPALAKYARDSAARLGDKMQREYKKEQLKLSEHMKLDDVAAARKDVRKLLLFTERQKTDYRDYLIQLDRQLVQRSKKDS